MFSLHFNLCNPAINNRGVLVGKWKLFTRSREDIADIRNFHAGNYCITAVTFCILMQRKNLPELLLVLSSGHTVHWEKLLVTCETNLWSKMQPKCGPFGNCNCNCTREWRSCPAVSAVPSWRKNESLYLRWTASAWIA